MRAQNKQPIVLFAQRSRKFPSLRWNYGYMKSVNRKWMQKSSTWSLSSMTDGEDEGFLRFSSLKEKHNVFSLLLSLLPCLRGTKLLCLKTGGNFWHSTICSFIAALRKSFYFCCSWTWLTQLLAARTLIEVVSIQVRHPFSWPASEVLSRAFSAWEKMFGSFIADGWSLNFSFLLLKRFIDGNDSCVWPVDVSEPCSSLKNSLLWQLLLLGILSRNLDAEVLERHQRWTQENAPHLLHRTLSSELFSLWLDAKVIPSSSFPLIALDTQTEHKNIFSCPNHVL